MYYFFDFECVNCQTMDCIIWVYDYKKLFLIIDNVLIHGYFTSNE